MNSPAPLPWIVAVAAMVTFSLMLPSAFAANGPDTWVGNTSVNFGDANWSGTNNPPISGDSWLFGTAGSSGTSLNNNLTAGLSVAGITFNNPASAYTIAGNDITLTGNIATSTSTAQIINLNMATTTARNVNIANGGTVTLNGVISGSNGAFNLGSSGGDNIGTLILTNSNTFTGNNTISQGTLQVSSIGNSGSTTSNLGAGSGITVGSAAANPAILNYTGSGETTNKNFVIGGTNTVTLRNNGSGALVWSGNVSNSSNTTARTLNLTGTNTNTSQITTAIANNGSGTIALTKSGAGTWALSGTNSYTGATTVSTGTLLINGDSSAASGAVGVTGATLGGTGTVGGATTVNAGGIVSAGDGGAGTLKFNSSLNLATGTSTAIFEAGDLINVTGRLSLASAWNLTMSGLGFQNGGSVTLFNYSTTGGTIFTNPDISYVGLGFTPGTVTLTDTGSSVVLNGISVVPEPATWALLAFSLTTVVILRRRRTDK